MSVTAASKCCTLRLNIRRSASVKPSQTVAMKLHAATAEDK